MCLGQGADLHMAQLMPLPLTISCSSKSRLVFTFLVPAHPGVFVVPSFVDEVIFPHWFYLSGVRLTQVVLDKIKRAVKRLFVCVLHKLAMVDKCPLLKADELMSQVAGPVFLLLCCYHNWEPSAFRFCHHIACFLSAGQEIGWEELLRNNLFWVRVWCKTLTHLSPYCTHTHTHTRLTTFFPGQPG